jgi:hypothetical protein
MRASFRLHAPFIKRWKMCEDFGSEDRVIDRAQGLCDGAFLDVLLAIDGHRNAFCCNA